MAGRRPGDAWLPLVAMFGLVMLAALPAVAVLAAALWAVRQPVGLDYAEPVVYGQALRVLAGEPLYQPLDRAPYTVAAYTPLYYWLGATLHALFGSGFGPGRAASLGAGLVSAALVAVLAARGASRARSGRLLVGAVGALLFLGFGFPGAVPWLALYRVDLLGVALSLASITWLARGQGRVSLLGAGALAGLALLSKQTLFAAVLAGTLWLWPNRTRLATFLAAAVAVGGVPSVVLSLSTGDAFAENTLAANLNPVVLATALDLLRTYVMTQWLPLVLAIAYVIGGRLWRTPEGRLLALYWAGGSVSLLGLVKIGANTNYWIELAAVTAVLGARAAVAKPALAWLGLIAALAVMAGGPAGAVQAVRGVRAQIASAVAPPRDDAFDSLVDQVRRSRGDALGEPMDVLVLAGRPVLLEPYVYNLRLAAGVWQPDDLVQRIACGQVGILVLGYPLESAAALSDGIYALWPAPVLAALQANMTLSAQTAGRYVYTPRHDPDVSAYQSDPPGCAAHP